MVICSCLGTQATTQSNLHPYPNIQFAGTMKSTLSRSNPRHLPCQHLLARLVAIGVRIVIMMGCFLEALPNSLRFGELFWFSQSSWDVSTLSTQHSQRKHFRTLCPSTKEIIACCMLKQEHLEPFDGLGGLSSHAVILAWVNHQAVWQRPSMAAPPAVSQASGV